jgi:hypothetical protein
MTFQKEELFTDISKVSHESKSISKKEKRRLQNNQAQGKALRDKQEEPKI